MKTGSPAPKRAPRGKRDYLFYVSLFVLSVSVFEILDLFELPFESLVPLLLTSGSVSSVSFVTALLSASGYLGVFALMILESASLPIPSEVVLPFAGYLAYRGSLSFAGVVAVSTVAGVAGALIDYYLALRFGRPVIERLLKWSAADPRTLDRAERWISKRGSWSILIARFIPGLRSAISLPAGALRMKMGPFVSMTAAGGFGWSVLLVYAGYSAGSLWEAGLTRYSPLLTSFILLTCTLASLCYVVYHLAKLGRLRPRGALRRFPRFRHLRP